MNKTTFVLAAGLAGMGAVLVAPSAVADPRISMPFVPVSVSGAIGEDGLDTGSTA